MATGKYGFFSPLFMRLFIPFGLGYFLSVLLGSANAIMSPILIETFSLSPADLGFMTSVYLIMFGLAQFPLGVMLDRYGARRTIAPMLLFAVAAAVVFGLSRNMAHLIISRALMGVGLGGCLMAAFKAYAEWLPAERLPLAYSIESLTGGIGGVVATRPLSAAFEILDWRVCFFVLAVLPLVTSALIWFMVPQKTEEKGEIAPTVSLSELLKGMLLFARDWRFWLVAPVVTAGQSVMFAYLYLWVVPWLRDVAGLSDAETGAYTMYAFAGAATGYFLNGVVADLAQRKNWRLTWEQIYLYSGLLITALLAFIAFDNSRNSAALWGFVTFLSTMTMISFPIMRRLCDSSEVGRALSLLNFGIFFLSFVFQWFIGMVLDLYPVVNGHFSPEGYRVSLAVIALINAAASVHLYFGLKKRSML